MSRKKTIYVCNTGTTQKSTTIDPWKVQVLHQAMDTLLRKVSIAAHINKEIENAIETLLSSSSQIIY